jgi:hypothetical protein
MFVLLFVRNLSAHQPVNIPERENGSLKGQKWLGGRAAYLNKCDFMVENKKKFGRVPPVRHRSLASSPMIRYFSCVPSGTL